MKELNVSIDSIEKAKQFVCDVSKYETEFDLHSGRYVIDGKSIMGIFSLDLSKPIKLVIHDTDELDDILKTLKPYIV